MMPPLKLNAIDQEHLQELYDEAGVARDELPYTEAFEQIWQGFDDRTFKNASREQVYAALLKHVRSSRNPPGEIVEEELSEEQLQKVRDLLPRHTRGGKMLPYSEEFEAARREFNQQGTEQLEERAFWRAVVRAQSPKRRVPARRRKAAAPKEEAVE